MSVLHELLNQIIDYAGLFPPAGLDLETVVKNYDQYRRGPAQWMLARIIIPAARLDEFQRIAQPNWGDDPWRVSALVPGFDAPDDGFSKAIETIGQFNQSQRGAVVDAIEVRCPDVQHVSGIAAGVPDSIRAFLEVPHALDPAEHLSAIKQTGTLLAKIRTGGVTSDLVPPTDQVARFIYQCGQMGLGFKATAGLHHPVRDEFNLTYQPDSERATMHGFLNVFVASVMAFEGAEQASIQSILESTRFEDFQFSPDRIQFGDLAVSSDRVGDLRRNQLISFGSCSFEEPIADLRELGFESEIQPAP